MDPKAEIDKISNMLKSAGFKLLDVQFEGVVEAMDARVSAVINKMAETQQAFGVFRVYYECEPGETRVIEIPVGPAQGEEGELPPEEEAPAPPARR